MKKVFLNPLAEKDLEETGLRLGVVADFQDKSSFEELHLNKPQNCHTKHYTRHYAKPLLCAAFLVFFCPYSTIGSNKVVCFLCSPLLFPLSVA